MAILKYLIFDADDTLWDNNVYFVKTTELFFDLCQQSGFDRTIVKNTFYDFEKKAVEERGYGSENFLFILQNLFNHFNSLKKLHEKEFKKIITDFINFTEQSPEVFTEVHDILTELQKDYDLFILTKGNIEEQKQKIKRSGIQHFFKREYVVSEKNDQTYSTILKENGWAPHECCMIGNSPKSDINPALRNGLYAIFVPYEYTWALDNEDIIEGITKLLKVKKFSEIPAALKQISEF